MKTVLSDFYSSEELAVAKILLMEDIDKLNLDTKRPHVPLQRDGDGRLAREMDDILSLFTFIDEQKLCTFQTALITCLAFACMMVICSY